MNFLPFNQVNNLFLTLPDTEFAQYCQEVDELVKREPKILELIDQDVDYNAKVKKLNRIKDKEWEKRNQERFSAIEFSPKKVEAATLKLQIGRPRMSAYVIYMFLMGRGYYGGIKSGPANVFTSESLTMYLFLKNQAIAMPSANSVYDNINAVSNTTRQYILDAQIRMIVDEKLDDFKELTFDSTAVSGNVRWPKDSMILSQLVKRIFSRGKSLNKFGIEDIKDRYFVPLIKEIQGLSNRINMESGKPKSKKNRKKHYQKLLKAVEKALKLFEREIAEIELRVGKTSLKPSKYSNLLRLVEMMKLDMENIRKVKEYCRSRIFENKSTPSKEKILSISDKDAGYIEKGNREAKIGYKPQIGRSKQGFVPAILIPKGNAADSAKLPELIEEALSRTKVLPEVISTDDGYVNSEVRNEYLKKGVKTFSFSGSKGKKLISEEDWSSEEYKTARNNRSSVESLMYTIKNGFDFGHVVRRGLENVRAELLEKVLAYNFCRIIEVRNKEQDEQRLKAA